MNVDRLEIQRREQTLTNEGWAYPSSTPAVLAIDILSLSDIKPGERVVDLASGASDLTARLLKFGVEAFGVDRLYLEDQNLDDAIAYYRRFLENEYSVFDPDMAALIDKSIETFTTSFDKNRDHYLGGWLTQPSVPANFADRAVSLDGLLRLAEDPDILEVAMDKAIEITKPGGKIVAASLYEAWGNPNYYRRQHEDLIDKLRRKNVGEVIIEEYIAGTYPARLGGHRLKVIKSVST